MDNQIDLAHINNNGQTLLHFAIETQSNSIFDIIFEVYAQQPIIRCDHEARRLLCLQDEKGRSGIQYSIELQNTHAVKQLLSSSVCIDSRDKQGMTVLHYAAKFRKDLENVSLILSHIQGVGIEQFDEPGRMVSILNASDKEGRNPLMLAIESTKLEAINAIMEYNPEFVIFDKQGRSVLHYAANNKQILESIIPQIKTSLETDDYLSLINKLNVTGLSALHLSISFSDRESAEYLVSEGARLVLPKDTDSSVVTVGMNGLSKDNRHLRVGVFDNVDQDGHIIGYKINSDQMICSTLPQLNDVEFYKNTDFEDSIQQTVISSVLKSNCPEILESLLELNKINPFDKLEDLTLIELASQCATLSMMQFLCENYKFPFEERDDSGRTVIHHLVYNPSTRVVDYLLQIVEDYEKDKEDLLGKKIIDFTDNLDCSPLKLCTIEEKWDNFIMLIKYGADFLLNDITTKEGDNILHIAIKNGDPELFKLIFYNLRELEINVDQTKKLMNKPNNANLSPIFYALNEGKIDLFLNEPDIEIEGVGENGSSLLHYAVTIDDKHGKHTKTINAIIRKREKSLNSRDSNKQTPLHYAVINMKLEALECFLQNSSLDLTCQDHLGNSALHCAAQSKTTECLSAIIKHVDTQFPEKLTELLNLQNSLSYTPLYSAIQSRNVNAIKILLKYNAKLPICLSSGTITFCNTNSSRAKVPLRLFKMKLKDESVPNFCVGFEVVRSSTWIVSDLPNLKESYLIQKQNGHTVTEIVSVTEDDLKRFILPCHSFEPLEFAINQVQFKHSAKLSYLAASNGSLEIMKFLSQRNVFSYLERDDKGCSIHHYATENENKEILKYLCHQTKNQYLHKFKELSGTLLHFTFNQDYFEAFKILLEESFDSDVRYTDNHEDTVLHLIVDHGRSVRYTKALLECSQFSIKSLISVLKREIRNEDWSRMCSVIPDLRTSMSFEQKLKILLRENYFSRDLSRLISLMSTIERRDILSIIQQYQKLFISIPEEIFSEKFENEIFSVKLTECSSLLELGDQFTPEDIKKLAKLPIIPSALCDNVTDGAEFLYILKEWGNHDPCIFYQELNAIGRSDLCEKAKEYPWLAAEHQTDSVTEEMSLKTLVRTLKTEIREKDWFRLCLIVPDLKARMSFEAKMNILIHEGYIARDLTRLCELMSVIKRHDIESILRNHQDVISIIPTDIDFVKIFKNEVAILEEETQK